MPTMSLTPCPKCETQTNTEEDLIVPVKYLTYSGGCFICSQLLHNIGDSFFTRYIFIMLLSC